MRALLLLSVVALAFLVVRWWSPSAAEAGGGAVTEVAPGSPDEPAASPDSPGVHFLTPPSAALPEPLTPAPAAASAVREAPAGAARPEEPASDAPRFAEPAPVQSPVPDSPRAQSTGGELEVAAALLHGTPADVQAVSSRLGAARGLVAEAFAWGIAGEGQLAASLVAKVDREQVPARERSLLDALLNGRAAVPASSGGGALARSMELALLAREAALSLAEARHADAARQYSALILGELDAPWPADARILAAWTEGLDEAQRHHRWDPRGDWPGVEIQVESGDNLIEIRKRYLAQRPQGSLMCTGLIERANAIRGYIHPGQVLRVPTDPVRVLVDLGARWALFLIGDEVAGSWPVGIGRPGEDTPPGDYVAIEKTENPAWMKVGQEPIPFGDERNPLGTRWIGWAQGGQETSYGFHGTKEPESIGHARSDGCVRFRNADVEQLFQILPEGAPLHVRP